MINLKYEIKQTENQRWGIYQDNRLLATVGNYEACESIWKYLQKEVSYPENIKSRLSYRNAIDKNLLINSGTKVI
ncbi:MAG TPA: hypothetical protein V6C71_22455 [Coleofasciculaceae cyanobacterium]|jgi:hypothetical protein